MKKYLFALAFFPLSIGHSEATDGPRLADWSGVYWGAQISGLYGKSAHYNTDKGNLYNGAQPYVLASFSNDGGGAGFTAGYNHKITNPPIVLGLEADFSFAKVIGASHVVPPAWNTKFEASIKQHWFATLRARTGYTWDRWMLFLTGGASLTSVSARLYNTTLVTAAEQESGKKVWGRTLGGGLEGLIDDHWSAKFEYIYVDYGKIHFFDPPISPGTCTCPTVDAPLYNHVLRLGVNYRFKIW
jgi:outer membrane immunogenic protein